jgi:cytochrome c biogenesis protein
MPMRGQATLEATPTEVVAAARTALRDKRFRLRRPDEDTLAVSAEKGYLKETGNLVFHLALLGIIVAVAAGSLFGWRGEIIIKEGESWTADAGTFDTLNLGPLVDERTIPTFTLRLDALDVEFESEAEGAQFGQPRRFDGVATVEVPGQEPRQEDFAVNHPLSVDGDSVYLLGNGYAPIVTVRDGQGEILYSDAVTFLPQDNNYGSDGAIKIPGRDPGLGLVGGFLPTIYMDPELGMTSSFPGLADPALVLTAYEGELFPDGRPQSVFSIETEAMDQIMLPSADPDAEDEPVAFLLRPGENYELPDGTVVEFEGIRRWAGLLVRHDPGRMPALATSIVALVGLGLMLGVKRRRVYVRVSPASTEGHTEITVAGLPKGSDPGLQVVVDDLLARVAAATGTPRADQPREDTA